MACIPKPPFSSHRHCRPRTTMDRPLNLGSPDVPQPPTGQLHTTRRQPHPCHTEHLGHHWGTQLWRRFAALSHAIPARSLLASPSGSPPASPGTGHTRIPGHQPSCPGGQNIETRGLHNCTTRKIAAVHIHIVCVACLCAQ